MEHRHIIKKVLPGSIGAELELEPGDRLISINQQEVRDVFDYHYLINDEYIELVVEKADGEEWELEIEKDYEEDLGIEFENGLMDDYRSCSNKCIFCFIDQLPKGMRPTMYFKDDDSRLSFLQGNYVTLTNMKDRDLDRIIHYHLSPINVSVHTTEPELRCMMLHNRFAGRLMEQLARLNEAGIQMNGQIVLCKGINDGVHLEKTIRDLAAFMPNMESLSVVPVGLSKFREGLYPLEPFEKKDAEAVLDMIETYRKQFYREYGSHFVHASDEWYLLADRPLPEEEGYDGYVQLENGVGMLRLLHDEFLEALSGYVPAPEGRHKVTIATGRLAAPFLEKLADAFHEKYPDICVDIRAIENRFFGERITVSGLLTGGDIMDQLRDIPLGETLLLPVNVLRSGEDVLLDDIHVSEIEKTLQVPVRIVQSNGQDLLKALLLQ